MIPAKDAVEVRVGELVHSRWTRYEIDSDLLTPADAWRVSLAQGSDGTLAALAVGVADALGRAGSAAAVMPLPSRVVPGARVEVRIGGQLVLTGRIDDRELTIDSGRHTLELSGRDDAGILLDCSAPIFTAEQMTLDEVIAKIVRNLGIKRHRINADATMLREKFSCEPGDTAWDALRRAAEANGLWPWFEPDGTLVIGGPNYDKEPVATLALRADGAGNNILRLHEIRSMHGRYSEVTVLGQSHSAGVGGGERDGRNAVRRVKRDDGVPLYRPHVVVDHEAINENIAAARASKIISDSRVNGYTLQATVKGHRTTDGLLWKPGQRVNVVSEFHGLDANFFLMARRFIGGTGLGQTTVLTLKEDRAWVVEAHPSRRRHRRGKNGLPGRILDDTGSAP